MKNVRKLKYLPGLVLILGLVGMVLRRGLYALAEDGKGLLTPLHPLEIGLWAVTAAAAVLILAVVCQLGGSNRYADNFDASVKAGAGSLAFAAGALLTVLLAREEAPGYLTAAWRGLGVLAALAMGAAGYCRVQGKRPQFLLHLAVCVFLMVHMVAHYQSWSGNPQLQDYVFSLLGCGVLMLFAYYNTAFDVGSGKRRMQLATGLLAVYLCCVAASRTEYPLLYLGGAAWALTDLCALIPVPRRHRESE